MHCGTKHPGFGRLYIMYSLDSTIDDTVVNALIENAEDLRFFSPSFHYDIEVVGRDE